MQKLVPTRPENGRAKGYLVWRPAEKPRLHLLICPRNFHAQVIVIDI